MPCDDLTTTEEGKALVVLDDENCFKELVQPEGEEYPAIAIALASNKVVLRNGSQSQPIVLPHLQTFSGVSFDRMMVQDSSGEWYAFEPSDYCIDQKLVVRDGAFVLVPDTLPVHIESSVCEVDACDEYDFLIGLEEVTLECDGEEQTFLKLVKVPKSLAPECVEEEEV